MVFKVDCLETKFETITSLSQFENGNCPKLHCSTLGSYFELNDKYQFPNTQFDQISDHKHGIESYPLSY